MEGPFSAALGDTSLLAILLNLKEACLRVIFIPAVLFWEPGREAVEESQENPENAKF